MKRKNLKKCFCLVATLLAIALPSSMLFAGSNNMWVDGCNVYCSIQPAYGSCTANTNGCSWIKVQATASGLFGNGRVTVESNVFDATVSITAYGSGYPIQLRGTHGARNPRTGQWTFCSTN